MSGCLLLAAACLGAQVAYVAQPDYEKAGGLVGTYRLDDLVVTVSGMGGFNALIVEEGSGSARVLEYKGDPLVVPVSGDPPGYVTTYPLSGTAGYTTPNGTAAYAGTMGYNLSAATTLNLTSLRPCTPYRFTLITTDLTSIESDVFQLTPCLPYDTIYIASTLAGFFFLTTVFALGAYMLESDPSPQSEPPTPETNPLLPPVEIPEEGDPLEEGNPQEPKEEADDGAEATPEDPEPEGTKEPPQEDCVAAYTEHGAPEESAEEAAECPNPAPSPTPGITPDAEEPQPDALVESMGSKGPLIDASGSTMRTAASTYRTAAPDPSPPTQAALPRQILSFGLVVLFYTAAVMWLVPLFSVAVLNVFLLSSDNILLQLLPLGAVLAVLCAAPVTFLLGFVNAPSPIEDEEASEESEPEDEEVVNGTQEETKDGAQEDATDKDEGAKKDKVSTDGKEVASLESEKRSTGSNPKDVEGGGPKDTGMDEVVEEYQEQGTANYGPEKPHLASAVAARLRARQRRVEMSKPHEGWGGGVREVHVAHQVLAPQHVPVAPTPQYPFPNPQPPPFPPPLPGQYIDDSRRRDEERQLLRERLNNVNTKEADDALKTVMQENAKLKQQIEEQQQHQDKRFREQEDRYESMIKRVETDLRTQHEINMQKVSLEMERQQLKMESARAREGDRRDTDIDKERAAMRRELEAERERDRAREKERELERVRERAREKEWDHEKERRESQREREALKEELQQQKAIGDKEKEERTREKEAREREFEEEKAAIQLVAERQRAEDAEETDDKKEKEAPEALEAPEEFEECASRKTFEVAASAASMPEERETTSVLLRLTLEGTLDDLPLDFTPQVEEDLNEHLDLTDPYITELRIQGTNPVVATFTAHSVHEIDYNSLKKVAGLDVLKVEVGPFSEGSKPIAWDDAPEDDPEPEVASFVDVTKEEEGEEEEEEEEKAQQNYLVTIVLAVTAVLEAGAVAWFAAKPDIIPLAACGGLVLLAVGLSLFRLDIGGWVLQLGMAIVIYYTYAEEVTLKVGCLVGAAVIGYTGYCLGKAGLMRPAGVMVVLGVAAWNLWAAWGEGLILGGVCGVVVVVGVVVAVWRPRPLGLNKLWVVLGCAAANTITFDVLSEFFSLNRYHVFLPLWVCLVGCGRLFYSYNGNMFLPQKLSSTAVSATIIACEGAMLWCTIHIYVEAATYTHVKGTLILLAEALFFYFVVILPIMYYCLPSAPPSKTPIPEVLQVLLVLI